MAQAPVIQVEHLGNTFVVIPGTSNEAFSEMALLAMAAMDGLTVVTESPSYNEYLRPCFVKGAETEADPYEWAAKFMALIDGDFWIKTLESPKGIVRMLLLKEETKFEHYKPGELSKQRIEKMVLVNSIL